MNSGLIFLSNAVKFGYPFIESITSFIPVSDEIVVVLDQLTTDNTEEIVKREFPSVRIVRCPFLLSEIGRGAYGIVRTFGYQACHGDIVIMFDADGVLHENDVDDVKKRCEYMLKENKQYAYWDKHRIYKKDLYHPQHKHKGVLNKKLIGDNLDFYGAGGADSLEFRNIVKEKSINMGVSIFGYEHVWDTEEVIRYKINRYGRMLSKIHNEEYKTSDEYFVEYIERIKGNLERDGMKMDMSAHPKIMTERLNNITEEHFGYNFFGY